METEEKEREGVRIQAHVSVYVVNKQNLFSRLDLNAFFVCVWWWWWWSFQRETKGRIAVVYLNKEK